MQTRDEKESWRQCVVLVTWQTKGKSSGGHGFRCCDWLAEVGASLAAPMPPCALLPANARSDYAFTWGVKNVLWFERTASVHILTHHANNISYESKFAGVVENWKIVINSSGSRARYCLAKFFAKITQSSGCDIDMQIQYISRTWSVQGGIWKNLIPKLIASQLAGANPINPNSILRQCHSSNSHNKGALWSAACDKHFGNGSV